MLYDIVEARIFNLVFASHHQSSFSATNDDLQRPTWKLWLYLYHEANYTVTSVIKSSIRINATSIHAFACSFSHSESSSVGDASSQFNLNCPTITSTKNYPTRYFLTYIKTQWSLERQFQDNWVQLHLYNFMYLEDVEDQNSI